MKKYDNLIKPDLVAPGNKIIGGVGYFNNYSQTGRIFNENPNLYADYITRLDELGNPITGDSMMYLSGTSMSAPVVSGTVALMLQANPNLTPPLVKAILMYSAQPLRNADMFEQGAGELNVDGAVRLWQNLSKPMLRQFNARNLDADRQPYRRKPARLPDKPCIGDKALSPIIAFFTEAV